MFTDERHPVIGLFSGAGGLDPAAGQAGAAGSAGSVRPSLTAVDLFSGAGGATQGLRDAGFDVLGAVEFDPVAAATYRLNHPSVRLWEMDVRGLPATRLGDGLGLKPGQLTLLKACPPCQGFSSLAKGRIPEDDSRNELVRHVVRFVRRLRPRLVLVENVPGLGQDWRSKELARSLASLGYSSKAYFVNAKDFGVPQNRRRLIILAMRGKRSRLPHRLVPPGAPVTETVRTAFARMAGEVPRDDPLSIPRALPERVLKRVEAIPAEGNRHDLPKDLQLECHKKMVGKASGATSPYGRLRWDEAAPTMTTRCTTPSCGSFLHPEEHRPITLREAATIQTFPADYAFVGTRGEIERQIGNAVPVRMASTIASIAVGLMRPERWDDAAGPDSRKGASHG
jgi:DNA (cytosine-5)-methyltransferase 1